MSVCFISENAYAQRNPDRYNKRKERIEKKMATITEERSVGSFNAIRVGGSVDVYLSQGNEESIRVEANPDVMAKVLTEVREDILHVNENIKTWKGRYTTIKVYVTFKNIHHLSVNGASDVIGKTAIKASQLKVDVGGASDLKVELIADSLDFVVSGASDAVLKGEAKGLKARVSGSSDFLASDLSVQTCYIRVSGAADAKIRVSEAMDCETSGSSDLIYYGNPSVNRQISRGASDIIRR